MRPLPAIAVLLVVALTIAAPSGARSTACNDQRFLGRAQVALDREGKAYDAAEISAYQAAHVWTEKARVITAYATLPCRPILRRYRALKLSQYAVLKQAWKAYGRGDSEAGNDLLTTAVAIQTEAGDALVEATGG